MTTYKGYTILREYISKVEYHYEAYNKECNLVFVAGTKELLYDIIDKEARKEDVTAHIEAVKQGKEYLHTNLGYGATVLDLEAARLARKKPVKRVRASLDDGNKLTINWEDLNNDD